MTYIETQMMTGQQLYIAIEQQLAEAEMHMITAKALLEVATERLLDFGAETKSDG